MIGVSSTISIFGGSFINYDVFYLDITNMLGDFITLTLCFKPSSKFVLLWSFKDFFIIKEKTLPSFNLDLISNASVGPNRPINFLVIYSDIPAPC